MNQASRAEYDLEKFVVIWVDATINLRDDSTKVSLNYLGHNGDSVLTFRDIDQCVDYITDLTNEQIFLILSESLCIDIIEFVCQIQQIESVYIFSLNPDKFEELSKEYLKIRGVYNDMQSVFHQVNKDILQSSNDLVPIEIIPSTFDKHDTNILPASFMYSQILNEILVQKDDSSTAKQEMIEFCQKLFATRGDVLKVVNEFDLNYQSDLAIYWYSRDCFLYPRLNRALRCQDIDMLYAFRFFIKDLHEQLKNLYLSMSNRPNTKTLYRGQGMKKNEFIKLRQNQLYLCNQFLSTTMDKSIAQIYVRCDNDLIGVLFEIEVDVNCFTYNIAFASIHDRSCFSMENEVLFSMGAIFRIKYIHKMEKQNNCYLIRLIIPDVKDKVINQLKEYLKNEIGDHNGGFYLASLMRVMGKYDKALHFYNRLVKDSSLQFNDPVRLSIIYNDIGCVYKDKDNKDYTKALEYYQLSLEIKEKYLPANDKNIAVVLSNIGTVYCELGMIDQAQVYFQRAIQISMDTDQNDNESNHMAWNIINMGVLYTEKGDYSKALDCLLTAKQIQSRILPTDHEDHMFTYRYIAYVHFKQSKYDQALINLHKALQIQKRVLFDQHPLLIQSHREIDDIYREQKNYEQALLYEQKTLQIAMQFSENDSAFIANTYQNMADIHLNQNRYEEALNLYRKSLNLRLNSAVRDDESIGLLYYHIGISLCLLGKLKDSLENLEKGLQILLKIPSTGGIDLQKLVTIIDQLREKIITSNLLYA
jgi:tetratricopeptide (TPR) repeat protein